MRTGDLVIHVPSDGSRGSGPYYVDNADSWGYGGDPNQVAVAALVYGPSAYRFGLPRAEVVVVGHYDVPPSERRGNAFTQGVLAQMHSVIEAAKTRFYERFPTFADGTTQVLLSAMTLKQRVGFTADCIVTGIKIGTWDSPAVVPNQMVYAVPRPGARTRVEATGHRGKFLLAPPSSDGGSDSRGHYVVVAGSAQR